MAKGYLALTLHAHLPFVRHPERESYLEEDWLFEAITETYLPLLTVFEGLKKDGVPFRLTLTMTPTLISMLADPLLQERYLRHLSGLSELAEKEIDRTSSSPALNELARMYHWRFSSAKRLFVDEYALDLVGAFGRFQREGSLEIITSAATHGYLPLLSVNERAVRAQVSVACDHYEKTFGCRPRGIWLPECGYQPGFENFLKDEGILFFFTDAHGVLHADPRPRHGVYAPLYTKNGVAAFGRDLESSRQVWSTKDGYPGDPAYRDFYRDIGFDLDLDYIRPYVQENGDRKMTGVKYHRITSGEADKEIYSPSEAIRRAAIHADDFVAKRMAAIDRAAPLLGRRPLIVSPYDAELFGHWWYEGPEFLNFVFRKVAQNDHAIEAITPLEYLRLYPVNQVASPSSSSWGHKGFSEVWLDESNDWIYRHLHKAADRMVGLADGDYDHSDLTRRALNQAARELLLAQSSDWAFIMKTDTMAPYARKRTADHLEYFGALYDQIVGGEVDESFLSGLEGRHNLFPNISYKVYQDRSPV